MLLYEDTLEENRSQKTRLSTLRFLNRGARIGFNNNIYLCSGFESSPLAFLVGHHVFNANLFIKRVTTVNVDLCLLRFAWKDRFYDLLDGTS
jgi:hypothetical protein